MSRILLSTFLVALLVIVVLVAASLASAEYCMPASHTKPPNTNPISREPPQFVRRVKPARGNGGAAELYTVGSDAAQNKISVVHLYGSTGYEWGYAWGQLAPREHMTILSGAWDWLNAEIVKEVNKTAEKYGFHLKKKFIEWLGDMVVDDALMLQWDLVKEPTMKADPSFYPQIQGLAAGVWDALGAAGTNFSSLQAFEDRIIQMMMLPVISQGACSFFGATKEATLGGKTLQLRALDFNTDMGLQHEPAIVIYHPGSPELGYPYANIGWQAISFVLTGMSSRGFGMSEIGISFPGPIGQWFGGESMAGLPFPNVEKICVQFFTSASKCMHFIKKAQNMCYILLGSADANEKAAYYALLSTNMTSVWRDNGAVQPPVASWHAPLKDVLFLSMDFLCPWYNAHMHAQLSKLHGKLTPELAIEQVTAVVGTGSLHTVYMNHDDGHLFVANARSDKRGQTGPLDSYARNFVFVDMSVLWNKTYGSDQITN